MLRGIHRKWRNSTLPKHLPVVVSVCRCVRASASLNSFVVSSTILDFYFVVGRFSCFHSGDSSNSTWICFSSARRIRCNWTCLVSSLLFVSFSISRIIFSDFRCLCFSRRIGQLSHLFIALALSNAKIFKSSIRKITSQKGQWFRFAFLLSLFSKINGIFVKKYPNQRSLSIILRLKKRFLWRFSRHSRSYDFTLLFVYVLLCFPSRANENEYFRRGIAVNNMSKQCTCLYFDDWPIRNHANTFNLSINVHQIIFSTCARWRIGLRMPMATIDWTTQRKIKLVVMFDVKRPFCRLCEMSTSNDTREHSTITKSKQSKMSETATESSSHDR